MRKLKHLLNRPRLRALAARRLRCVSAFVLLAGHGG
jgi:hypothetical protein